MAASPIRYSALPRPWRWRGGWILILVVVPVMALAGLSWWLTAPMDDDSPWGAPVGLAKAEKAPDEVPPRPDIPPPWPESPIEGQEAKTLLLSTLLAVAEQFRNIEGYTATFSKQERIHGVLGPEQTLAMKVRQQPFAVYFKFLSPNAGKEVVYAEGHHDNKVIAHSTGVSRWLVPRLAVPPDHPLALAETRHSITEAGVLNLTNRLIGFRRKDLEDPEAETRLDRITDPDGRPWLRSIHSHPNQHGDRPFKRTEVLYDPETRFPMRISNYDWPEPGHTGELALAERYAYDDLRLNAPLSALDFDPANPAYTFHRY